MTIKCECEWCGKDIPKKKTNLGPIERTPFPSNTHEPIRNQFQVVSVTVNDGDNCKIYNVCEECYNNFKDFVKKMRIKVKE